jgi:hypothetical protein
LSGSIPEPPAIAGDTLFTMMLNSARCEERFIIIEFLSTFGGSIIYDKKNLQYENEIDGLEEHMTYDTH